MIRNFISLVGGAALATSAAAAVVDQDTIYTKDPANGYLSSSFGRQNWITQSFTPGLSGSLVRLDLQIGSTGPDDLRIRIGKGEITDSDYVQLLVLDVADAELPQNLFEPLFGIDLVPGSVALVSGEIYSITLSSVQTGTGNSFGWVIGEVTPGGLELTLPAYADGRAQGSSNAGATWGTRGVDRPFRTWVETGAVPEPASWALMILGFGTVGISMRRNRPRVAAG